MLATLLEYRYEVMSTMEDANRRSNGPHTVIKDSDWDTARSMCDMLEPFAQAVDLIEGDKYITLSFIPLLMDGLNAAILQSATDALTVEQRMAMVAAEITRFRATTGLQLEASGNDTLAWWAKNQHGFPYLARLAETYLAIPATSATSERVFSIAGNTVTNIRNRLRSELVDALVFLH
ncbi:unnamed protein product, partial [Discosporangium mesarthrocarpum]